MWRQTYGPRFVLPVVTSAQLLIALDTSVLNVALPTIGEELSLSQHQLSWIASAYLLTFGGLLLLGGRLSDLIGPRSVFLTGTALFAVGSAAGGVASGATALIVGRAVQGVGAALLSPAGLSILTRAYSRPASRRNALAIWSAVCSAGAPAGMVIGGVLTASFGWPSVLLVNVPLCLGCLLLTIRFVPQFPPPTPERLPDGFGAVLITASLFLSLYGLTRVSEGASPPAVGMIVLGVVAAACFVRIEGRARYPLFPRRALHNRSLTGATVVALFGSVCAFASQLYVTLYLARVTGRGPLETGLALLPFGIVATLAPLLAVRLLAAIGSTRVILAGFACLTLSSLLWAAIDGPDAYVDLVLPGLVLGGLGTELLLVSAYVVGLSRVDGAVAGLAAAVLGAAQLIGGAVGFAIGAVVFTAVSGQAVVTEASRSLDGLQAVFLANAAIAALGPAAVVMALRRRGQTRLIGRSG